MSTRRALGIGIATITAVTGLIYWKWRVKQQRFILYSELITNIKTASYLHCYSLIRYYLPLLINNITILSIMLLFYKHIKSHTAPSINPISTKRYYTNRGKIFNYDTFSSGIGNIFRSWHFIANDILFIASNLNILSCIITDQMFNSDPFHPLMLFENNIEYTFIHQYKASVNKVINEYINNHLHNRMNNDWLLHIIWQYITYDTKTSHMIIDVKFTNPQLKHQSFICRKYKSILSTQFEQYQQDMKFVYAMNDKESIQIQPNFEYFWKIRSFGFDINILMRDYLSTFKLKDSQQITQFMLWCMVNIMPIYAFNNIFKKDATLCWIYASVVITRESAFYAALIRITSFLCPIKLFYRAVFWYRDKDSSVFQKQTKSKTINKQIKAVPSPNNHEADDWYWNKL